jgi:hypothetical protein
MPLYKINDEVRQLFQAACEVQSQIDELKSKKVSKRGSKLSVLNHKQHERD